MICNEINIRFENLEIEKLDVIQKNGVKNANKDTIRHESNIELKP